MSKYYYHPVTGEKVVIEDFLKCPFVDTIEGRCKIRIFTQKSWCEGFFQKKYIVFVDCPLNDYIEEVK